MRDLRKMTIVPTLGYVFGPGGTIGRAITQQIGPIGLAGLGDAHSYTDIQSIGQQLTQTIQNAPAELQPALAKVLTETSSYGPSQTVAGAITFWSKATGNGNYMDRDYALIAQALSDANAIIAGAAPSGPIPQSTKVQDILALGQQFQSLLQQVPSSLTTQANAILSATTTSPPNTVAGIIKFYTSSPSGSNYTDRDYAFMATQLNALQNLLSAPPPVPQTPTTSYQVNTSGQPVYTPAPLSIPTVAPGTPITYVGPAGTPAILQTQVSGGPAPQTLAVAASTDPLGLPSLIPGVPTTYLLAGGLLLLLLARRKSA